MTYKAILAFILSLSLITARGQFVSIPDTTFGNWLYQNGLASSMTGNSTTGWQLNTIGNAALNCFSITLPDSNQIQTLEGIEYIRHLIYLDCGDHSKIQSIPAVPSSLVVLICTNDTSLTGFPTLPSSLSTFYCWGDNLHELPELPSSLTSLDCDDNLLDSLPLLPNTLQELFCVANNLSVLPTLPDSLHNLSCDYNRLTTLPPLPAKLYSIACHNNRLTTLPQLPDSIQFLDCNYNQDLACLPYLHKVVNLQFIGTAITCLPDTPQANQGISPTHLPICSTSCLPSYIDNLPNGIKLNVYPNPASNNLYTDYLTSEAILTVIDMTGRNLSVPMDGNRIDISALPSGLYFLRMQNKSICIANKFVKD